MRWSEGHWPRRDQWPMLWLMKNWTKGVFLVKMKNVIVPFWCIFSVTTYSWISTWGSERSKWASLKKEASEWSEHSKASKWAEWAVWANKRSERLSGLLKTRLSLTRNAPSLLLGMVEIYEFMNMFSVFSVHSVDKILENDRVSCLVLLLEWVSSDDQNQEGERNKWASS